jgi:predicted small secreted protein
MKIVLAMMLLLLAACNTTSGILTGVGKDLQGAGEWVRPQQPVSLK